MSLQTRLAKVERTLEGRPCPDPFHQGCFVESVDYRDAAAPLAPDATPEAEPVCPTCGREHENRIVIRVVEDGQRPYATEGLENMEVSQ